MFQLLADLSDGIRSCSCWGIQELGYETNVENGRIFFSEGDASAIVKANLWLHSRPNQNCCWTFKRDNV